jgi:hypothetical protein
LVDKIISLEKVDPPVENLLQIAEPEHYHCSIWAYRKGMSIMTLEVRSDPAFDTNVKDFQITFERLLYFEGPMHWNGVNIRVAPMSEYHDLLVQFRLSQGGSKADLEILGNQLPGRLCIIKSNGFEVKFIAYYVTSGPFTAY